MKESVNCFQTSSECYRDKWHNVDGQYNTISDLYSADIQIVQER